MHALPVDSLVALFQCDWCWFENLAVGSTNPEIYSDIQMLGYIRWSNLSIIWSREKVLVSNFPMNISKGKKMINILNLNIIELTRLLWSIKDTQVFQVVI